MRRRVAASLRRRRTVRYFFIFAVLHASFSFGVWPIESRSGCDGVTLFMRPFLVTLRGSCEVPKKTDFFPQDLSFFFFIWPDRVLVKACCKLGQADRVLPHYIIPWCTCSTFIIQISFYDFYFNCYQLHQGFLKKTKVFFAKNGFVGCLYSVII